MLKKSSGSIGLKGSRPQRKLKVLLLGDNCIDRYVYGTCDRLSREAPIPILTPTRQEDRPGMGCNVRESLLSFNLDVTFITSDDAVVNTRYIDERYNHQLFRVETDKHKEPRTGSVDVQGYDAVVISDYGTGYITYDTIDQIQRDFDGPIFVDSKKTDLARFERCFVKINKEEWEARTSDASDMIVSLGGEGALYAGKLYPVPKVEVSDVCGAGDTFLAALVAGYLKYGRMENAICTANLAGAIAVQHMGCYTLNQDEVQQISDKTWEEYNEVYRRYRQHNMSTEY